MDPSSAVAPRPTTYVFSPLREICVQVQSKGAACCSVSSRATAGLTAVVVAGLDELLLDVTVEIPSRKESSQAQERSGGMVGMSKICSNIFGTNRACGGNAPVVFVLLRRALCLCVALRAAAGIWRSPGDADSSLGHSITVLMGLGCVISGPTL